MLAPVTVLDTNSTEPAFCENETFVFLVIHVVRAIIVTRSVTTEARGCVLTGREHYFHKILLWYRKDKVFISVYVLLVVFNYFPF
jgi:hypothetical protein